MDERRVPSRTREWGVPVALILLCAIPLAAGAVRLVTLAVGAEITPENARFFAAPLPVVLHIVAAAAYIVLGCSYRCQATLGAARRSCAEAVGTEGNGGGGAAPGGRQPRLRRGPPLRCGPAGDGRSPAPGAAGGSLREPGVPTEAGRRAGFLTRRG